MRELIERRVKGLIEFNKDYGFNYPEIGQVPIEKLTDQELLNYYESLLEDMSGVQE